MVPLVLSGPLCPAGISPPRGESPLKGRLFYIQAPSFILGSPLGHPKGVPCAELSPQVTEGFPATAANRFHKELRFFFSLLKRKKEAKKEKSSRSTCTTRSNITRRLYREFSAYAKSFIFMWEPLHRLTAVPLPFQGRLFSTNKTPPAGQTGGCCRRNTTLFTVEIGA